MDAITIIAASLCFAAAATYWKLDRDTKQWNQRPERRPTMHLSACGRYYFSIEQNHQGFVAVFAPLIENAMTETIYGFKSRAGAMRCIIWLACEHGFAEAPVSEEVGRGDD